MASVGGNIESHMFCYKMPLKIDCQIKTVQSFYQIGASHTSECLLFTQQENNKDGSSRKEFWTPLGGTATLPPDETNPLLKLFMDVSYSQESILQDHLLLTNRINLHRCSHYCLRKPHSTASNNGKKVCRIGFGST